MKKIFYIAPILFSPLFFCGAVCGCGKETDYFDYVSEYRSQVYFYKDDYREITVYCSTEENPYLSDGYVGDMGSVTEIYYTPSSPCNEVEITVGGKGGEMNYLSVKNCYYLSFDGMLEETDGLDAAIICDGKETELKIQNVGSGAGVDGREALNYVVEYDGARFEKLKKNNTFEGEIGIRLLYDDGCYYYVGLCDREKNLHAYLVDGDNGRIIVEKD